MPHPLKTGPKLRTVFKAKKAHKIKTYDIRELFSNHGNMWGGVNCGNFIQENHPNLITNSGKVLGGDELIQGMRIKGQGSGLVVSPI